MTLNKWDNTGELPLVNEMTMSKWQVISGVRLEDLHLINLCLHIKQHLNNKTPMKKTLNFLNSDGGITFNY